MLKNYMEIAVDHLMPSILKKYGHVCTCDRCIEDIKAIALNNLEPMYTVSEEGTIYDKVNELKVQFETDIITELTKAAEIVSKHPRHNI